MILLNPAEIRVLFGNLPVSCVCSGVVVFFQQQQQHMAKEESRIHAGLTKSFSKHLTNTGELLQEVQFK